jgi:periplasmic protein TonB
VASFNTSLGRFFAVSLALHALAFLLLHPQRPMHGPPQEKIPVSLLPLPPKPEQSQPETARTARVPRSRPTRAPTIVAKKDSPITREKSDPARGRTPPAPSPREDLPAPDAPTPAAREPIEDKTVVAERELPTLKELLPPATWSSNSRNTGPVSLNTRDPIYVSYFNKIKQSIELQWEYPELALRYGLQGRLALEFTIASTGQLDRLRIIRSSGSQVLDGEALRAIKAAAPFPPIPSWIKTNPLFISATMEYNDNRLNYRYSR